MIDARSDLRDRFLSEKGFAGVLVQVMSDHCRNTKRDMTQRSVQRHQVDPLEAQLLWD